MVSFASQSADSVLSIDDDEAEIVLSALSTESARRILTALKDDRATVSELAEKTGLTTQNVAYHLGKLNEAELVQVVGTRNVRGNEAAVYAPAKTIMVSTETSSGYQLRTDKIGLFAGVLVAVACISWVISSGELYHTILHEAMYLVTLLHQFLHLIWLV